MKPLSSPWPIVLLIFSSVSSVVDAGGTATGISAGRFYACAVTSGGAVQCWGNNQYGQLGDGTTTQRSTPTAVSGLESGVAAVSAGHYHACALTSAGGVLCWGSNGSGRLGDGTTTQRLTPTPVSDLASTVATVAAGGYHTCALTTEGGVLCWGFNNDGQVGDGTTTSRLTPTPVTGLASGVTAIVSGERHSCALTAAGGVHCWGSNWYGQLGDGTTTPRGTPAAVSGLETGVAAIAAGYQHTCAVTTAGAALCWGDNGSGELGDGTATQRLTPVAVSGLGSGVAAITAGLYFTCALTAGGAVRCWGYNGGGQLGDGTTTGKLTPGEVAGFGYGAAAISAGYINTCALTTGGGVRCWGHNYHGQIGDGTTTNRPTPTGVSGLEGGPVSPPAPTVTAVSPPTGVQAGGFTVRISGKWFRAGATVMFGGTPAASVTVVNDTTITAVTPAHSPGLVSVGVTNDDGQSGTLAAGFTYFAGPGGASISAGYDHTCAVTSAGAALCWGSNTWGEIGDGTTTTRLTPTPVSGLSSGVAATAQGSSHTCALMTAGAVLCWGENNYGQIGDGSGLTRKTPVGVSGLGTGITAIATGSDHSCAVTTAGALLCWGDNTFGQLGDGTTTRRPTPTAVSGLGSGVRAVSAGLWHTCALITGGAVKCWGYNGGGQVGDGTSTQRLTPTPVTGLDSGVAAIGAAGSHTCALATAGGVSCWGAFGSSGRTPTAVAGLETGVTALATGEGHSCVLKTSGGVVCWGSNYYGQIGAGVRTDQWAPPTPVTGLDSGAVAVAAGSRHSCALLAGGGISCWGDDTIGELGDGTAAERWTPTPVVGLGNAAAAVATGSKQTCAVTTAGAVLCWGTNRERDLWTGTWPERWTPTAVTGLGSGVAAVSAGLEHTCALMTSGGVSCWGFNDTGQLGDGTTTSRWTPAPVSGLGAGVAAVKTAVHSCALTASGGVVCWGPNSSGQLGDGTTTQRLTPTPVSGLGSNVVAITVGYGHSCALTSAGGVLCWGDNGSGQLGDGTTTDHSTPVPVIGLGNNVAAVAAGGSHTCAVTTGGAVACWGSNNRGQLGDGTRTSRLTAVAPTGLGSGVTAIAAGYQHTCALMTTGGLLCWGDAAYGQVGNGTKSILGIATPAQVTGLASGVIAVAAGYQHTCAVTAAGGVFCWGADWRGQLGNGARLYANTPVRAYGFGGVLASIGIVPASGSTGGGTVVTITGSYFLEGAGVTLGGVAAGKVSVVNLSTLVATTSAHAAGAVDVVVRNPDGQTATLATGFTYVVLPSFTDDPLVVRSTVIRGVHITELRQRIDELRARFGLGSFVWTDAALVPGATRIKAAHLSELRAALNAVYAAASRVAPTYTHATATAGLTTITAVDIAELRAALLAIW